MMRMPFFRRPKPPEIEATLGSGNVFADLGLPDAENLQRVADVRGGPWLILKRATQSYVIRPNPAAGVAGGLTPYRDEASLFRTFWDAQQCIGPHTDDYIVELHAHPDYWVIVGLDVPFYVAHRLPGSRAPRFRHREADARIFGARDDALRFIARTGLRRFEVRPLSPELERQQC